MNNQRRKILIGITELLEEQKEELNNLIEEEEDAKDAIPESLQASEKGDAMQNAIDFMEEAVVTAIDEAISGAMEAQA